MGMLQKVQDNPMMQGLQQIAAIYKASRNPQAIMPALQQMAANSNNPNMQKAVDYIQANQNDLKGGMIRLAQEKNADPNQVLTEVKNRFGGIL